VILLYYIKEYVKRSQITSTCFRGSSSCHIYNVHQTINAQIERGSLLFWCPSTLCWYSVNCYSPS